MPQSQCCRFWNICWCIAPCPKRTGTSSCFRCFRLLFEQQMPLQSSETHGLRYQAKANSLVRLQWLILLFYDTCLPTNTESRTELSWQVRARHELVHERLGHAKNCYHKARHGKELESLGGAHCQTSGKQAAQNSPDPQTTKIRMARVIGPTTGLSSSSTGFPDSSADPRLWMASLNLAFFTRRLRS